MYIAIVCTGLDHVHRGFETFSNELFNNLSNKIDINLLKGSGLSAKNIHILPTLKRTSNLYNFSPFNRLNDYHRYRYECLTFGISLLPLLFQEKYSIIHVSDWILGDFLLDIRRKFNLKFKLILSNGAPYEPSYCNRFDAIQQVALSHYQDALSAGVSPEKMFLVPYGFEQQRLVQPNIFNQEDFRRNYRIPTDAFVIVSLAALNYTHKRIDWLIKEFSNLNPEKFYLLMVGQKECETSELETLAKEILPKSNYQFLTLPYDTIPSLLWSSDLMVLCSLFEGFGRVVCEAMGAGLPLLLHPHPTAKWLIDCQECFVDMTTVGHLHEKIIAIVNDKSQQSQIIQQNFHKFANYFEWGKLSQSYVEMYQKVVDNANC